MWLTACAQNIDGSALPTPNGRYAAITSDYPAVVLVELPNRGGICTGTFVGTQTVLTAAHCSKTNGKYTILSSFGTFTASTRVVYGSGSVDDPNDIALLFVDQANAADPARGRVYGIGDPAREGDTVRLIGYGCNNVVTRGGSGVKRTGTNIVYRVSEYLEFASPYASANNSDADDGEELTSIRRIGGDENISFSCFGDSGGPGLAKKDGRLAIVGVTHAGGRTGSYQISEYIDLSRNDNRAWLAKQNEERSLGIEGL